MIKKPTRTYAWFPVLRFRSSVQIGSSSIFSVPVRSGQRQWRYGTAVRTRLSKRFMETDTETDTDERKRNAGTRHYLLIRVVFTLNIA